MISKAYRRPLRLPRYLLISSYPPKYNPGNSPRFFSSSGHHQVPDVEEAFLGNYSVILPEEPFIWGVSHIIPRNVPTGIASPPYARARAEDKPIGCSSSSNPGRFQQETCKDDSRIQLGTEEEIGLRASAKLAREVREFCRTLVRPGETTNAIDAAVHDFIISRNAYPSPLLYSGFPRSCCTSINNVVAHGIPDDRPLEDGDIINIDVTVYLDGYHGDTSQTFFVGNVDQQGRDLVSMTHAALQAGISACGPGRPFSSIGRAIHKLIRDTPYSVCNSFSGHGISKAFHQPPWIYHTLNEEPGVMHPGHCFTIEPCIVQGTNPRVWIFPDGWTASTENCARSAQAEHMVLITETGAEVLTL